jgi:hypothetical protein
MPPTTPGGYANQAGTTLEQVVEHTLGGKGFRLVSWAQYRRDPSAYGPEVLVRHVPYRTIYGHQGKTEFVLHSVRYGLDVRIECKWQQSAGSVDEKFPYVYLNAADAMPEPLVLIIVDGGGAKPAAVQWLRDAARERRYLPPTSPKEIRVLTIAEFIAWANTTFR